MGKEKIFKAHGHVEPNLITGDVRDLKPLKIFQIKGSVGNLSDLKNCTFLCIDGDQRILGDLIDYSFWVPKVNYLRY